MRTRLYVAGAFGGLALLAVAVVVVFAFGRNDPSPPSLRDEPNTAIPGQILYLDDDGCFIRAQASGAGKEKLACTPQYFSPGSLYWLDSETAGIVQYSPSGQMLYELDLRTGQTSATGWPVTLPEKQPPFGLYGGAYAPDDTYAFFDENGALFLIQDGVRTEIADFDVPEYRQPQAVLWSPDSQWLLASYYGPRQDTAELWIISRDGQTQGTLATDLRHGNSVAWRIEGIGSQPEVPDYQR